MTTIKTSTGIFAKVTKRPDTTTEAISAWRRLAEHPDSIEMELATWEAAAMLILRAHGIESPGLIRETPEVRKALARPDVQDAIELIYAIWAARDYLEENNAEQAALAALRVGQLSVKMHVRPAEAPAVTGRKVRQGAERGRNSDGRTKNDAPLKHAQWREYADELRRTWAARIKTKRLSDRAIALAIAKHFGEPAETIRKALRKKSAK